MIRSADEYRKLEALVLGLQRTAVAHPRLYQLRVLGVVALGYFVLVGVVVLLVALVIGGIWSAFTQPGMQGPLTLLAPALAGLVIVLRALWVEIPTPRGIPATPERFPDLFRIVEEVRQEIGGPRIDAVLLDMDVNAGVVQVPRLGVFGWHRNYLVLGLALMQVLSVREFRAALAHEMAHLLNADPGWGAWIYRQHKSWNSLLVELRKNPTAANQQLARFAKWYAPLFNAYSVVMSRVVEYRADRLGASLVTNREYADALVRIELASRWIAGVGIPHIQRHVRKHPLPTNDTISALCRWVGEPTRHDEIARGLMPALSEQTGLLDSHPCLRERLEALGEAPRLPDPVGVSAMTEILGDALPALMKEADKLWSDTMLSEWQKAHAEVLANRERLAKLDAAEAGSLSAAERWERARLLWDEERGEEGDALIKQIATDTPEFAPAQVAWGLGLLRAGDEAGLVFVDRALALGGIDVLEACRQAHSFLTARGRPAEAERYVNRAQAHIDNVDVARQERATFVIGDPIEPHGLPESELQLLRDALKAIPEISSATLVRKKVQHFPEMPFYGLAVLARKSIWQYATSFDRREHLNKVRSAVIEGMPIKGDWACLLLDRASRKKRARFEAEAGEPFYRAP